MSAKKSEFKKAAELIVLDRARKYALLSKFGVYLDNNGSSCTPAPSDLSPKLEYAMKEYLDAAVRLLLEDTIQGGQT